jgi:CheY-like chemotaxis protein
MKAPSVLIVEDEALIALHIQEILENAGYAVLDPVPSGEDAIACLNTFPHPDLIFMDITLDGTLGGIETVREIRKKCKIPVIFLTAHSMTAQITRDGDLAPCTFMGKPFNPSDIVSAVEKALNR